MKIFLWVFATFYFIGNISVNAANAQLEINLRDLKPGDEIHFTNPLPLGLPWNHKDKIIYFQDRKVISKDECNYRKSYCVVDFFEDEGLPFMLSDRFQIDNVSGVDCTVKKHSTCYFFNFNSQRMATKENRIRTIRCYGRDQSILGSSYDVPMELSVGSVTNDIFGHTPDGEPRINIIRPM